MTKVTCRCPPATGRLSVDLNRQTGSAPVRLPGMFVPQVDDDIHFSQGAVGQSQRHWDHTETRDRKEDFTEQLDTPFGGPLWMMLPVVDKGMRVRLWVQQAGPDEVGQLWRGQRSCRRQLWFELEQHHLLGFLQHISSDSHSSPKSLTHCTRPVHTFSPNRRRLWTNTSLRGLRI